MGRSSCVIQANSETFGQPCGKLAAPEEDGHRLAVKVLCEAPPLASPAAVPKPPLPDAPGGRRVRGLVNGDAEAYPNSALGVALGIMRGQDAVLRPFPDYDTQTG